MLVFRKLTKKLNIAHTGNYIIPIVIVDYRETRLVTIEHLAKLIFSGVSSNHMEFHQFVIGVSERISAYLRKQNKPDQYFLCVKKGRTIQNAGMLYVSL